jgi:hypothetical protein
MAVMESQWVAGGGLKITGKAPEASALRLTQACVAAQAFWSLYDRDEVVEYDESGNQSNGRPRQVS